MRRGLRIAVIAVLLAGCLAGGPTVAVAGSSAAVVAGLRTITGTIEGAGFRVDLPSRWNGTLVLFSHGYGLSLPAAGDLVGNRPPDLSRTRVWLLEHGYALAASNFTGVRGFTVEPALRDQIALLDWFGAHVGRPSRTISDGQSMGATIAVQLAERNPHRFDGVANRVR